MSRKRAAKMDAKKPNMAESAIKSTPEFSRTFADLPRWILPSLVVLYCVMTLLLIARVPLNGAPDEAAHFKYVEHLATLGTLPVFKPLGAIVDPGYEFHQPPLYYAICAPLWNANGPAVEHYLCRLVSLCLGAATLCFLWSGVRRLFPQSRALPILATALAALWPMHIGVGASGGNDAAAGFFCAAMLWCLARGSDEKWTLQNSALLGLFCGLGMLTKSTALPVAVAATLGACFLAARGDSQDQTQNGQDWKKGLAAGGLCAGVALLVCGWWLVRNTNLYGDPLALGIINEAFAKSSPTPEMFLMDKGIFLEGVSVPVYLRALLVTMFYTSWGFFGGPTNAMFTLNPFGKRDLLPGAYEPVPLMMICAAATLAVIAGLTRWRHFVPGLSPRARTVFLAWLAALAFVFYAWLKFNTLHFQGQARYLHSALLPMALLAALGWREMFFPNDEPKRFGLAVTIAFALVVIGLTLWNAFGWRSLN